MQYTVAANGDVAIDCISYMVKQVQLHGLTITVKDASGNVKTGATNALSSFY